MALDIQVLAWDRCKNVAELNLLMESQLSISIPALRIQYKNICLVVLFSLILKSKIILPEQ
jgi:hypothetical protein